MVEKHGEPAAPKRRTGLTRVVLVLAILLVLGATVYMIGMSSRDTLPDGVLVAGWPESGGVSDGDAVSTTDRPDLEEFQWYDTVRKDGVWQDAERITKLDALTGSWKGMIVYALDRKMEPYARELLNVTLTGTEQDCRLTLDWYQMCWKDRLPRSESNKADSVFSGAYRNNECYVTGSGSITLGQFCRYEGKEYAFGSLTLTDGNTVELVLMRP